jgi:hypothetical protein
VDANSVLWRPLGRPPFPPILNSVLTRNGNVLYRVNVATIENNSKNKIANCKLDFMGVQMVRWDAEERTINELKHKPLKIDKKNILHRKHIELKFFKIRRGLERV